MKKWIKNIYYVLFALLIFVGAGLSADLLWNVSDVFMGFMALINIPVIVILGRYSFRALDDYKRQKREGKDPVFLAKTVGLEDKVDYWQE